ncbi:hypothetical protein Tco_1432651, partial [Tanacetum coccineum]
MARLPPRDQRHLWLHYQVEGYTDEIVHHFEQRLETLFKRQLGGDRRSMTWRQFNQALGLHTAEEMAEDGFEAYWLGSERVIPDKGDLSDYWVEISSSRDFLRGAPSYTYIKDPVWRLCHRLISYNIFGRGQAPEKVTATYLFYLRSMDREAANILYLLAHYLFGYAERRKSGVRLSEGHFIRCLGHHFGLPDVAAGDPRAIEDALVVDEDAQADPAPVQAPQLPPPAMGRTMPQRLGRLEEEMQGLRQDVRSLCGLVERSMTDQGRFSTWMISCMTQLKEASEQTYQAFDGTFRGSSQAVFERRTRQRTDGASTSAAPISQTHDPSIPYLFTYISTFIISIMMYLTLKYGTISFDAYIMI